MKDRFLTLASTLKASHDRADKIRKAAREMTDIELVYHYYRDLILDVEAGVGPDGDPIIGLTDWTWGDYKVQKMGPDGIVLHNYYFHEDVEEWRHHYHSPTWRQYRMIAQYVAEAHTSMRERQERFMNETLPQYLLAINRRTSEITT